MTPLAVSEQVQRRFVQPRMTVNIFGKTALLALCMTGLFSTTVAPAAAGQTHVRVPAPKAPKLPKTDDLKAFPAAKPGQIRHVIRLPEVKNPDDLKVELIVGKTMQIDCNNHMIGGELQERTAEGWGYTYYTLDKLGPGASTLMGCPDRTTRTAFVRTPQQLLVRYNPRLPLVIYAPADAEIRYRIWRADPREVRVHDGVQAPRR